MKIDYSKYLFIPYRKADCFQLAKMLLDDIGFPIPDYEYTCKINSQVVSGRIKEEMNQYIKLEKPKIPCLVAIKGDEVNSHLVQHIGVYVAKNKVLNTDHRSKYPFIFNVNDSKWKNKIEGFYAYREWCY